jgi:hypothetical protein
LIGETEVLGENLPQRDLVHHKFHLPDTGSNPSRRGGKPASNRLCYGAALLLRFSRCEKLVAEARGYFGNPEQTELPPLEAATRRLVKTQQAEETYTYLLVCAVVNCIVCELAIAL